MATERVQREFITVGIGILEFGNYDTAGVFQGYDDVGPIKGTFGLNVTREVRDFESGRPQVILKREVIRERVEIAFRMAEMRVANLKMAAGGGIVTSSIVPANFLDGSNAAPEGSFSSSVVGVGLADTYELGGQCTLDEIALRFTHVKACNTGKRQIIEVYKAQATGVLNLPFNEEDWNVYDVTFLAIADTTRAAGKQLFRFIDER